jgi:hypothetical protein
MKKLFTLLICSLSSYAAVAQTLNTLLNNNSNDTVVTRINTYRTRQITPVAHNRMLVSYYSWKNLVKSDFSALTGLDNSASVGKYAALNINQTTSTFTFTPITISPAVDKKNYNVIHSFDFTGTLDKTSVLDLKNWRSVSLSYSLTYVFDKTYKFLLEPRGTTFHKPVDRDYIELYDDLETKFIQTYLARSNHPTTRLNHPEYDDPADLRQAWLDSVARYEKLLIKDSWTSKRFGWIKASANALAFDNAEYIITGDATTYDKPKSKAFYTPGLMVSGNYYWGLHSGWNFYISLYVQGVIKDTFTDIFSTSEWNKTGQLTDSAVIKKDSKNVYLTTDGNIKTRLMPNTGIEGIVLFPASAYIGCGLDLSLAYNGIISNQAARTSGWLQNVQAGLILSFKDKTGKSTINIEPYYQRKKYINYTLDSSHLWGVKLSIPFSRLY